MAKKAKAIAWKDLGMENPVAGCHEIIQSLQEMKAPLPQAPVNSPVEEQIDAKVAAAIARQLAKGRIIR